MRARDAILCFCRGGGGSFLNVSVQEYREREHVRLMWMSAMVRVFEARLLGLWEERQRLVDASKDSLSYQPSS